MGRSYCFECSKCGYRATVSGGTDCGIQFCVQTIHCRDCGALYDAVTRFKVPDSGVVGTLRKARGMSFQAEGHLGRTLGSPPSFAEAIRRLPFTGAKRYRWVQFDLQCPIGRAHRVRAWDEPGKCPRCGAFLEKNSLPYRLWD
jgi:hypothetical protein